MEQEFSFIQCWTCDHLVYDMRMGYICQHTGNQFTSRVEVVKPTACNEWKRS